MPPATFTPTRRPDACSKSRTADSITSATGGVDAGLTFPVAVLMKSAPASIDSQESGLDAPRRDRRNSRVRRIGLHSLRAQAADPAWSVRALQRCQVDHPHGEYERRQLGLFLDGPRRQARDPGLGADLVDSRQAVQHLPQARVGRRDVGQPGTGRGPAQPRVPVSHRLVRAAAQIDCHGIDATSLPPALDSPLVVSGHAYAELGFDSQETPMTASHHERPQVLARPACTPAAIRAVLAANADSDVLRRFDTDLDAAYEDARKQGDLAPLLRTVHRWWF